MKIRVLFVDDEMIVRVALKSMIHWEETEFEIIGAVADGEAALEALEKNDVHIIVTDLKMPGMDGMDFIDKLIQAGFTGKIVVLSSYGEFELAREAMRHGVVDYLLKANFTPDDLLDALRRAASTLHIDGPCESWVEELTEADFTEREIHNMLYENGHQPIPRDYGCSYRVLYILEQSVNLNETEEPQKNMLSSVIGECMSTGTGGQLLSISTHEVLLFYPENSVEDIVETAEGDFLKISATLQIYMNSRASFVLSKSFSTSAQLQLNLCACAESAKLILYKGYGILIRQDEAKAYCGCISDGQFEVTDKICDCLTMSEYEKAQNLIRSEIQRLYTDKISVTEAMRFLQVLYERITLAYSFYFENDKERVDSYNRRFIECFTLSEYQSVFFSMIDDISISLVKMDEAQFSKKIMDIVTFIKANINSKITLSQISNAVNMTESYISRLFKNETGANLMSYVNMLKMERAMELLKNPDTFVKEAARQLGYEDQSYFNRIFNKYFGISPMEFKKNYKNRTSGGKNNTNPPLE